MNKPELLIFDLDGTLLDTLTTIAEAFNLALEDMDCPTHPIVDYRYIVGDGVSVAAKRGLPADRQQDIEECIERFKSYYDNNWHQAKPYDGIVPLLESLKGRVPLAVLSNKDEKFTRQIIDHVMPGTFDVVLGFRAPFKHKPDPAGANWIMSEIGVDPSATWMIGDTATDMKTANACSMTGVGVLWGFRDEKELTANGASLITPSPRALFETLEAKL